MSTTETTRIPPVPPGPPVPPRRSSNAARIVAIVAIAVGAIVVAGNVATAAATTLSSASVHTSSRTIGTAGVDTLDVDVNAGSLRVEFADVGSARLRVTAGPDASEWTLDREGSGLVVRSPDGRFRWWGGWFGRGNGDAVLTLPNALQGMDASLDLSAGALSTDGRYGNLALSAGAGRLSVRGAADTLSARVDAGRADLALADVHRATLTVNAGDVDARLTGAPPSQLELSANAGSMTVAVPRGAYDVTAQTSAGAFDNRVGSVPGAARTVRVDVAAGHLVLKTTP